MMLAIRNRIGVYVDAHPRRMLIAVLTLAAIVLLANSLSSPIAYAGPDACVS